MATLFDLNPPVDSGLKLNEAQRRAITHGEGPLLVIAGAIGHQQWPSAVRERAPLRLVQLQPGIDRRIQIEQRRHDSRRVADFTTNWKSPWRTPRLGPYR